MAWGTGEPSNCFWVCGGCVAENVIQLFGAEYGGYWNDVADAPATECKNPAGSWIANSFIIEWSADCNNDGLIDYGQILAGDLSDANANNIPDCCEGSASCDPCPADIVHDGFVNAIDLAAVLNNWGSAGGKINADANDDGLVDAQDLAIVLSAWGACE